MRDRATDHPNSPGDLHGTGDVQGRAPDPFRNRGPAWSGPPPTFTVIDTGLQPVRLSGAKGKVVIVCAVPSRDLDPEPCEHPSTPNWPPGDCCPTRSRL
jgi:hypothetical protein